MSRAGLLRQRVTLERQARTPDLAGGAVVTWRAMARLWVHIAPRRGREKLHAERPQSRVTHEVTLRYRKGLSPDMRFKAGDRILKIHTVTDPDQTRCWHHCECSEVQS